jgi:tetratricopeptide (TPR) repeat protein
MDTLSATSLDVIREYASAMDALSRSRFDLARDSFQKAVTLDPNFGLGYAGLAIASRNLDKQEDAEKYVKQALEHLDGMTEREIYRTRGMFYYITNDYPACVNEYGDLIKKFAGDAAARNNLALCQTYLRQLPQAVEQMQQVIRILPNRALYRENLALYAAYSGDFRAAEQEVKAMPERGLFGLLGFAFAQIGQGQMKDAARTYLEVGNVDQQGASYTASGLGDLAIYDGRWNDAVQILTLGASADRKAKEPERAAPKFAAIALGHVGKEYPHKLDHVLLGDEDALPPRVLHPIFFGSFDWHSCVHGWWTLLTLRRLFPEMAAAPAIAARADEMLVADKVAAERAYLDRPQSAGFERPYGWGWLLYLHLEASRHWTLRSWDRTQIPKPFSTVTLAVGEPIYVDRQAGDAGIEEARRALEARLHDLEQRARDLLTSG